MQSICISYLQYIPEPAVAASSGIARNLAYHVILPVEARRAILNLSCFYGYLTLCYLPWLASIVCPTRLYNQTLVPKYSNYAIVLDNNQPSMIQYGDRQLEIEKRGVAGLPSRHA